MRSRRASANQFGGGATKQQTYERCSLPVCIRPSSPEKNPKDNVLMLTTRSRSGKWRRGCTKGGNVFADESTVRVHATFDVCIRPVREILFLPQSDTTQCE